MKRENLNCIGNCRLCSVLGECPADHVHCEDCGTEIETGEGIEVEVEAVQNGRHGTKMITACPGCFAEYYQGDETIEFN